MSKFKIDNIERVELMENKCGVRLDALYAEYSIYDDDPDQYITVYGEIHAIEGASVSDDFKIVFTVHNSDGKVIAKNDYETFNANDFIGLLPFEASILFELNEGSKPVKIKIYPTKYTP